MGAAEARIRLRPHGAMTPYLFVAPAFAVLAVFVLWAFAQVVLLSFMSVSLFGEGGSLWGNATFVGLENYRAALGSERFWWCLANSFFYLLVTPAIMVVSLAAALTVTSGLRGISWVRVLLFLPVVTPTIVAAVAWRVLFRDDGVINGALSWVGVGGVGWTSSYPWVLVTAMTVTLFKGFGYYMMIFVAALLAVPRELEEAAEIDGAGRWGVFRHVTLPTLAPVLVLVAMISSISALKVFDEIYVTVRNIPTGSKTAVPLIFDTAFEQGNFGLACAIGVLLFVVILAFSVVNLRLTRAQ
jgi:putative chitobiose transport system permease protein